MIILSYQVLVKNEALILGTLARIIIVQKIKIIVFSFSACVTYFSPVQKIFKSNTIDLNVCIMYLSYISLFIMNNDSNLVCSKTYQNDFLT